MERCDGHNQVPAGHHEELIEFDAIFSHTAQDWNLSRCVDNRIIVPTVCLDRVTPSDRILVASLKVAIRENLVDDTLSPSTARTR